MRRLFVAVCALTYLFVSPSAASHAATDSDCPRISKEALSAWYDLSTVRDPVLDRLYERQTEIVGRIKKLANSDAYNLQAFLELQREHDEAKIGMERRRSENTAQTLRKLPQDHQRDVLRSLYGGC